MRFQIAQPEDRTARRRSHDPEPLSGPPVRHGGAPKVPEWRAPYRRGGRVRGDPGAQAGQIDRCRDRHRSRPASCRTAVQFARSANARRRCRPLSGKSHSTISALGGIARGRDAATRRAAFGHIATAQQPFDQRARRVKLRHGIGLGGFSGVGTPAARSSGRCGSRFFGQPATGLLVDHRDRSTPASRHQRSALAIIASCGCAVTVPMSQCINATLTKDVNLWKARQGQDVFVARRSAGSV